MTLIGNFVVRSWLNRVVGRGTDVGIQEDGESAEKEAKGSLFRYVASDDVDCPPDRASQCTMVCTVGDEAQIR